jgi:hypothetical protein
MSTNIKVFKLVSGDEIIGSLIESQDDSIIKINQPMIFRTSTMMDNKGYPYDVTILKDWMIRSDVKIAEIPKVQVSTVFSPNEKTMNLYSLELKRLSETPSEEIVKAEDVMDNFIGADSTINDIMDNFINAMDEFADYQPSKNNSKKKKKKKPAKQQEELNLESFIPDELKKRPMIYLSMVIPPEAIMNLVTAGILDPDQLLAMIEEVKKENKFTGDEKKRKDFGNKFSDWNPDPESHDYE